MIDSLDRLLRFVAPLERDPNLGAFAGMPLPSATERSNVRDFRNRIAHGDEDIEKGIAGKGPVPATVHPAPTDMTIEDVTLEYDDLARMLEQVHDYLRAATWRGAAKSAKAR